MWLTHTVIQLDKNNQLLKHSTQFPYLWVNMHVPACTIFQLPASQLQCLANYKNMCWSASILNKPSKTSTSSITMKAKILKCINICKNFCKENLCLYILKVFIYNCILLQQYILCASSSQQATSTPYASASYLSHNIIPSQKKPCTQKCVQGWANQKWTES